MRSNPSMKQKEMKKYQLYNSQENMDNPSMKQKEMKKYQLYNSQENMDFLYNPSSKVNFLFFKIFQK